MSALLFQDAKAIELRDYQLDAIERVRDAIRDALAEGKKGTNVLLCAPTGSGKTVIGSHFMNESNRKMKRSGFLVDRTTLVNQTSEMFDQYGIDHGVIQADHPRRQPWQRVQIMSAMTILRRAWPDLDLLIVDEAHTVIKVVADRIAKRDCIVIGLTATPFSKGLGKIYDALVNVTTTNSLIEQGFLSPFRIYAAVEPDMTGVKVVAGEWVEREASKRALEVVGDVVLEYQKFGQGRKFLASACDVAHAEEMAKQFNAAGIVAEAYSYMTPDAAREVLIKEFRRPDSQIRGLISPVALTKGFDVPDVSCLIMARPLRKSLAEHIQFFGRGLRISPEKKDCIVLDHSGNSARFWVEWNDFFEIGCLELDDGKPKPKKKKDEDEEKKAVKCPRCHALHAKAPKCPSCGYEYPKVSKVQYADGELREIVTGGERRKLSDELWPQLCGYARERRPGDPVAARKMALALFKGITGVWPTRDRDFDTTPSAPLSAAVSNKIRANNIRYVKSREKAERSRAAAEDFVQP